MLVRINLVSAVPAVLSVVALAVAIHNGKQLSDVPSSAAIDDKIEIVSAKLAADVEASFDAKEKTFETDVEQALEAIIERRREQAQSARAAAPSQPAPAGSISSEGMLSTNAEGQVVYGNPDAEISIYTFEDFRCGFCARYSPVLQQFVNDSGGEVNWIYKPYPVLGPPSTQLAVAGECVSQIEGAEAFWRFSEQAYATKNWVTAVRNAELADIEAINTCVQDNTYGDRIDQSMAEGRELNVTGTPASIFRNNVTEQGALIPGMLQSNQIAQMVEQVKSGDLAQ